MRKIIQKIDRGLYLFENSLLILILGVMVLMAFLQVVLRNLFHSGILWGDIFLRHLVLWVGFIGASLATRSERHINIDVLTRLLSKKIIPYIRIFVNLVAIAVGSVLVKAAFVFVRYEYEAKTILFTNIPAWYFELIIPVGFALISFRFLLKVLEQVADLFSGEAKDSSK